MKISFIIVSHNTIELLRKCVSNLLSFDLDAEIIVVDNESTDGSREMLEKEFSGKITLFKELNKGLAFGSNIGYKASKGDYLIYVGSDAYPTKSAIEELINYMELNPEVGVVTPRLVLRDESLDKDAHRGFPTPWTSLTHFLFLDKIFPKSPLFARYFMSYADIKTRHEIDTCISHFMCVSRKAQYSVGLWDEDLFLYGEDIDFCYRIKEAGYKIMFLGDVEVLHYKGAGVGRKTSIDLKTASSQSHFVRKVLPTKTTQAMRLFYIKHMYKKNPGIVNGAVLFGIFLMEKLRLFKASFK